ncbi:hypothetical protein PFISCL1PPCAC_28985, partial [Pristionchus fissidentatus]
NIQSMFDPDGVDFVSAPLHVQNLRHEKRQSEDSPSSSALRWNEWPSHHPSCRSIPTPRRRPPQTQLDVDLGRQCSSLPCMDWE